MAAPIKITRGDLDPAGLRRAARWISSVAASRRMLASALVMDGVSRTEAAQIAGMDRQPLRDWVHCYNAEAMPDESELITVSEEDATRQRAIAEHLTNGVPPVLRTSAITERSWLCVAVEDELEGVAAERLAAACATARYTTGWSVEIPWQASQVILNASRFTLTARALQTVARDVCLGSPFVLVEELERFAVASSGDLYWMLAGKRAFVEAAVGATVEQQLATFEKVAQTYSRSGSLAGATLTAVHTATIEAYTASNASS